MLFLCLASKKRLILVLSCHKFRKFRALNVSEFFWHFFSQNIETICYLLNISVKFLQTFFKLPQKNRKISRNPYCTPANSSPPSLLSHGYFHVRAGGYHNVKTPDFRSLHPPSLSHSRCCTKCGKGLSSRIVLTVRRHPLR